MAKQFFYISIGILALAVAYHLIAVDPVEADWNTFAVGCFTGVDGNTWYSTSGEAWDVNGNTLEWYPAEDEDLPVSTTQIELFGSHCFSTTSGDVWVFSGTYGWRMMQPFPSCGGTATEKSSWGDIKREFK